MACIFLKLTLDKLVTSSDFLDFVFAVRADVLHLLLEPPRVVPEQYRGFFDWSCHSRWFYNEYWGKGKNKMKNKEWGVKNFREDVCQLENKNISLPSLRLRESFLIYYIHED